MLRSVPQFLLLVLVLGLLLLRESRQMPLAGVEEGFIDWLAGNSDGGEAPAPLVLVQIDEESLAGHPWPWLPLDYASFLDGALRFQAWEAAIEPVLAWDEKKLSNDELFEMPQMMPILHERILRTPKLLLGARLGLGDEAAAGPAGPAPLPALPHVQGSLDGVPEFGAVQAEPAQEIRLTAALGFTNVPGGTATQRAPLLFRCRGAVVPSFILQGIMLWYGVTADEVQVRPGDSIRIGNRLTIPIDSAGAMLVDWKTPYARVPFGDFVLSVDQVENGHVPLQPAETFRGKLLLLARTDAPMRVLALPYGRQISAGELFAAALATVQTGATARPAGWEGSAALLVAALGLGAILMGRPRLFVLLAVPAFVIFYLIVCLSLFEGARIVMPLTPALGLALFVAGFRLFAPEKPAAAAASNPSAA